MAPDADSFNKWYSEMEQTPRKEEIEQRHLGLPPHLLSTSLLPWEGIAEVTEALRLSTRAVLLDLACGRGGYGLEVASRTGASLVGVDFSEVAVRMATANANALGREADFRIGSLTATGLADSSVDAVMCIDAIQFAEPPEEAYDELHRVLRPRGRVVLTCWETTDPDDESTPSWLRDVDLGGGLAAADFVDIVVLERPDWLAKEMAMWREVAALDPGDDPTLQALHDEGAKVLAQADPGRRCMASAIA